MTRVIDLTGRRFGRLVVVERAPADKWGHARWRVRCECGEERIVQGHHLRRGLTRSCGCLAIELSTARLQANPRCPVTTHGHSGLPEYHILAGAHRRCTEPSHKSYSIYGGRGIEYRLPADDGEAVLLLRAAIGPRPDGMTLDRIDNDGHYEIGNLRWATRSEQQFNRRKNALPSRDQGRPLPPSGRAPLPIDNERRNVGKDAADVATP
jgi:hypothetical protein